MRVKSTRIRNTVRRRKTNGNRKTVQPLVSVLKREPIPWKANVVQVFPPVCYGRVETAVERKNAEGEHKIVTIISAGLKERAKIVEEERTKKNTKNSTSNSASLKERAKTVERERKKHATQGGEARGLA